MYKYNVFTSKLDLLNRKSTGEITNLDGGTSDTIYGAVEMSPVDGGNA